MEETLPYKLLALSSRHCTLEYEGHRFHFLVSRKGRIIFESFIAAGEKKAKLQPIPTPNEISRRIWNAAQKEVDHLRDLLNAPAEK
ncbi:MAG TPA: hypothetical protein VFM02_00540 [Candidatus Paceibacterota bacterium]|nr:hypothetical protein [Candidatus Paceibacterota bacterium]